MGIAADEIAPRVRALLDELVELLDMAAGNHRFEVVVRGGKVEDLYLHEKIRAAELSRFDKQKPRFETP